MESQTYPVEDLRLAPATVPVQPQGRTLFFISPVKLPLGKNFTLVSPTGGMRVEIYGCFGFVYSLKYLVTGVITDLWEARN